MTKTTLTIATRESPLALWQANWVKTKLQALHPHLSIHLLGLTTAADRLLSVALWNAGGKGLFVKELEEALLDGRADIAVHSMKDVPVELPSGLCLPVFCEREEPRDAFISSHFSLLSELPQRAKVGTSSLRRQSQLLALRPDLQLLPLRGNINSRLRRLEENELDAIILAAAGLKRLQLTSHIRFLMTTEDMLPAAGQGVLGIECREDAPLIQEWIAPLNNALAHSAVTAERAVCRRLNAGCQVPVAAFAEMRGSVLHVRGLVASVDGKILLRAHAEGDSQEAETLGIHVAEALLQQGAEEILKNHRNPHVT
jgi:hydroxymethylbilane synthase